MKKEIVSREDVKYIITVFYDKMLNDAVMFPFFEEFVNQGTLENHLDVITDFWEDILFETNKYSQNVLKKHLDKNAFLKFEKQHFNLWLAYFNQTIDQEFEGEKVILMKNRAQSIATVMQLKMNLY